MTRTKLKDQGSRNIHKDANYGKVFCIHISGERANRSASIDVYKVLTRFSRRRATFSSRIGHNSDISKNEIENSGISKTILRILIFQIQY